MSLIILYGRSRFCTIVFRRSATKLSIRDIRTIISVIVIIDYVLPFSLSLSLCVSTQSKYKVWSRKKEFVLPRGGIYFSRSHPIPRLPLFSYSLRFAWRRPETFTSTSFYRISPRPFARCARAIFPLVSFKSSRDVFCEIIVVERRNAFSRILHFHARSVAKPLLRSKRIRKSE